MATTTPAIVAPRRSSKSITATSVPPVLTASSTMTTRRPAIRGNWLGSRYTRLPCVGVVSDCTATEKVSSYQNLRE
jgi:hypothetical protein